MPRLVPWVDNAENPTVAGWTSLDEMDTCPPHDHDAAYAPLVHTHPGGSEAFPVGAVFISVVSTNPGTLLGYGTWAAFGAGRVLVGLDSGDADFDTAEETGGAKTVTLTAAQSGLPQHTHTQDAHSHGLNRFPTTTGASSGFTADTSMSGTPAAVTQATQAATATNQDAGPTNAAEAHSIVQPYIVVYMFKRTA